MSRSRPDESLMIPAPGEGARGQGDHASRENAKTKYNKVVLPHKIMKTLKTTRWSCFTGRWTNSIQHGGSAPRAHEKKLNTARWFCFMRTSAFVYFGSALVSPLSCSFCCQFMVVPWFRVPVSVPWFLLFCFCLFFRRLCFCVLVHISLSLFICPCSLV